MKAEYKGRNVVVTMTEQEYADVIDAMDRRSHDIRRPYEAWAAWYGQLEGQIRHDYAEMDLDSLEEVVENTLRAERNCENFRCLPRR